MNMDFCSDPAIYLSIKETKTFGIVNYELLHLASKDLSPSGFRCYLTLLELNDKVGARRREILPELEIYPSWLTKKNKVDPSTTFRNLNELREKGFMKVMSQESRMRVIVGAPKQHLTTILDTAADRHATTKDEKQTSSVTTNDPKMADILDRYNQLVKRYVQEGLSQTKAYMKAGNEFTEDEKTLILTSEKNLPQSCEPASKPLQSCNTRETNIKNNLFVKTDEQKPQKKSWHGSCSKFKNISKDVIRDRVTKLLQRAGESILQQVGTLNDVIDWVYHHVKYRNPDKTKSDVHALNAAISMLERGVFSKPKSLSKQHHLESLELERRAKEAKEQEWQEIKNSSLGELFSGATTC